MTKLYRIAKWAETFETCESRRHKNLTWVSLPIDLQSNGYQSLIENHPENAQSYYGAWCAMVAVAANCPVRGTLAASNGTPYTIKRIASLTHMNEQVIAEMVEWASSKSVGWLEVLDENDTQPEPAQSSPSQQPEIDQANPGLPYTTLHNTTLPNTAASSDADEGGSEEPKKRLSAKEKPRTYSDAFNEFWGVYWNKSGKAAAYEAFKPAITRIASDPAIPKATDNQSALQWLVYRTKLYRSQLTESSEKLHASTYLNKDRFNDELKNHRDPVQMGYDTVKRKR